MTIPVFNKGDLVRVRVALTDGAGVPVDPTVVRIEYAKPDAVLVELVYGVDAAVVKDSTGHYHTDIDGNVVGMWWAGVTSTGTGQASNEMQFRVKQTRFD